MVDFKTGDIITLTNSKFKIEIGMEKGSECAVPGLNCGNGYIPPHPTYKIECGGQEPYPCIAMALTREAKAGKISIQKG